MKCQLGGERLKGCLDLKLYN